MKNSTIFDMRQLWCNIKSDNFFIFTFSFLIIFEIVQLILMHIYTYNILDSDMSSELILAHLLSKEGKIVSSNWYYSTELRVLGMQIIDSILFNFSNNWHFVRMGGTVIIHLITIVSVYCFCKVINLCRFWPVLSLILLMPISFEYYEFTLFGNYYMPFMAISFFAASIIISYVNSKNSILLFISGILSFAFCLGGARPLFIFYIPVLLLAFLLAIIKICSSEAFDCKSQFLQELRDYRLGCIAMINFVCGLVGLFVNTHIFSHWFNFSIYKLNFTLFNGGRFLQALTGFLSNYGYRTGPLKISTILTNGIALILFISVLMIIFYTIKHKNTITKIFYGYSLCLGIMSFMFVLLYSFTDMVYSSRYGLPIMVFFCCL